MLEVYWWTSEGNGGGEVLMQVTEKHATLQRAGTPFAQKDVFGLTSGNASKHVMIQPSSPCLTAKI